MPSLDLPLMADMAHSPDIRFPREGGDPDLRRAHGWLALIWIPAFAGNAALMARGILVLRQAQDEDE